MERALFRGETKSAFEVTALECNNKSQVYYTGNLMN